MSDALKEIQQTFELISKNQDRLDDADRQALDQLGRYALGDWGRRFKKLVHEQFDTKAADLISDRFANAFSSAFQEAHTPQSALEDAAAINRLIAADASVVINFSTLNKDEQNSVYHLSIYHQSLSLSPSRMLQIIENLGFVPVSDQHFACNVMVDGAPRVITVHDFPVRISAELWQKALPRTAAFEELIQAIWEGDESDGKLNELVLLAQMNLREIKLMRAINRYLIQARLPYSRQYCAEILVRHSQVARQVVDYFHARFDPAVHDAVRAKALYAQTIEYIIGVKSLDEDRVLRHILIVVECMLRTNFYQQLPSGESKPQLSFKLDSSKVMNLPQPAPMYETFVYSHRVEGIHLRNTKISRGGIRWSDRRDDFWRGYGCGDGVGCHSGGQSKPADGDDGDGDSDVHGWRHADR